MHTFLFAKLVLWAVARVEIWLFQAAGFSASGSGPVTTPAPREGNGSELVKGSLAPLPATPRSSEGLDP